MLHARSLKINDDCMRILLMAVDCEAWIAIKDHRAALE